MIKGKKLKKELNKRNLLVDTETLAAVEREREREGIML